MGFQSTHRAMSDEEFRKVYLAITEATWRTMPVQHLAFLAEEVERRGLAHNLGETLGELTLPHERWAKQRVESVRPALQSLRSVGEAMGLLPNAQDQEDRLYLTRLANDPRFPAMSASMIDTVMSLPPEKRAMFINGYRELQTTETDQSLPEASTESGETSNDEVTAPVVVLDSQIGQPSSGTSRGAPITAESGFDVVAYRRLPLVAKRDAFIDNGFLYVRSAVLKSWIQHLTQGKCCRPQREALGHHASDCWIRDAVR
jgi:hypothetical protein